MGNAATPVKIIIEKEAQKNTSVELSVEHLIFPTKKKIPPTFSIILPEAARGGAGHQANQESGASFPPCLNVNYIYIYIIDRVAPYKTGAPGDRLHSPPSRGGPDLSRESN